jgi:RNA polymerase sigma-70 factor (ECF subfamily)
LPPTHPPAETTTILLARARAGDRDALEDLFARYLPALRRWARGRLPGWARDLLDTQDIVQDALLRTFKHVDGFDHRGDGALHAYLRQAVTNRIRDEIRRVGRHPPALPLDSGRQDPGLSPLEAAIGVEAVDRYDTALRRLPDEDREVIVARVELGLTYAEVADATGRPTANAARMAVARGLVRLAEAMKDARRLAR